MTQAEFDALVERAAPEPEARQQERREAQAIILRMMESGEVILGSDLRPTLRSPIASA